MARYALVKDEVVVNLVVWDGTPPITWPDNQTEVLIPDNSQVDFNWNYKDGEFSAPMNS